MGGLRDVPALYHTQCGVQAGREAAASRPDARRRVILSLPLPYSSRHLGDVTPARDASDLSANNRTQLFPADYRRRNRAHDRCSPRAPRVISGGSPDHPRRRAAGRRPPTSREHRTRLRHRRGAQ